MALGTERFLVDRLKEREICEMGAHPIVEILDIGDSIDNASWTENVCVLCKEGGRDDAGLVLAGLEVGIWEEEKEGRERMLCEEVGEELHRVGSDDRNIIVMVRFGCGTQRSDAVCDILGDLHAYFKPEDVFVGKSGRQLHEETAKAAANISPLWRMSVGKVVGPVDEPGAGGIVEGVV